MARSKKVYGFWVEYADMKSKKKGIELIKRLGGKVKEDFKHLNYLYAIFSKNGFMEEEGILRTLRKSKLFKKIRKDENLFFFGLNEKSLGEDYICPKDYLHLTEVEKLRKEGITGKGVKVGVIDSGVDLTKFGNRVKAITKDITDRVGHGTAVVDIINNIAPESEIYVGKVTTSRYVDVRKAILLMEEMRKKRVDIVNISFGGIEEDDGSHPLAKEAEYLAKKGIIVVCAIGNDASGVVSYPSSAKGVISVGSVNKEDKVSYFSNYGITPDGRVKPEVLSYGENICVSKCRGVKMGTIFDKNYVLVSGTSFACPMVSGISALLKGKYKDTEKVKEAIFKTADKKKVEVAYLFDNLFSKVMRAIGINILYLGLLDENIERWGKYGIVRAYKALKYLERKGLNSVPFRLLGRW